MKRFALLVCLTLAALFPVGCASTTAHSEAELRVFPLQFAQAAELAEVLRSMRFEGHEGEPRAQVAVDQRTNSLIVSACAAEVAIFGVLIERLDVQVGKPGVEAAPAAPEAFMQVVPLKYASAPELATNIEKLHAGTDTVVVADSRTNSLVVQAHDERELTRLLDLIARLDVQQTAK